MRACSAMRSKSSSSSGATLGFVRKSNMRSRTPSSARSASTGGLRLDDGGDAHGRGRLSVEDVERAVHVRRALPRTVEGDEVLGELRQPELGDVEGGDVAHDGARAPEQAPDQGVVVARERLVVAGGRSEARLDRKSTRLNSSHSQISYAVFCLK